MTARITRPGARNNPPGRHGHSSWMLYEQMPWTFIAALENLSGDQRNTVLLWAVEAGWSPTALALALGVRRQQVMRWIATASYTPSAASIPIPAPEQL